MNKKEIDWKKGKGLVPTIVQDSETGEVLMLAYSSKKSLCKAIQTGQGWYYSRRRKRLWRKGTESGNTQEITGIAADCDADTLLFSVKQKGNACHLEKKSCFFRRVIG